MRDDAGLADAFSSPRLYDLDMPGGKPWPCDGRALAHRDGNGRASIVALPVADRGAGEGKIDGKGYAGGSLLPDLLQHLGLSQQEYEAAVQVARRNGSDAAAELVASGRLGESELARAFGRALGMRAAPILPEDQLLSPSAQAKDLPRASLCRMLRTSNANFGNRIFLAPRIESLDGTAAQLRKKPQIRAIARITTPGAIARALAETTAKAREEAARLSLSRDNPVLSARQVISGAQGMVLAMIAMLAGIGLVMRPGLLLATVHAIVIPLFLCCVLLRCDAAIRVLRRARRGSAAEASVPLREPEGPPPVYSVLVALHRESEVVGDLVRNLERLDWPRSRLQVMLVCEGDDTETIAAATRAIAASPGFEIVVVAPSLPRTKPKALNVALPLATGEFVVLYDAEDRPHPSQLKAAYAEFRGSDARLACLQAPLVIANGARNWLAGHFALEYAALFRGLLPCLAARGWPLPLGGTSNHFRRAALMDAGGWDSHNVTEDADLGIRLCRMGYRTGIIDPPTFEDAPERFLVWRNQRTRWMKGWLQTWCVHMREPLRLYADLGPGGFLAVQLLFLGMVASALAHPLFFVFVGMTLWSFAAGQGPDLVTQVLIAADLVNLVLGYVACVILSTVTLDDRESRTLPQRLWTLHAYWLLVSLAAVRALLQLIRDPHSWEKTPHGAASRKRPSPSAQDRPILRRGLRTPVAASSKPTS